jgi:hypothetical protein
MTTYMTPLGHLNCTDSIELLSSGRRIQEFSREVILAKMIDNPSHIGKAHEEGIGMITEPSVELLQARPKSAAFSRWT